MWRLLSLCSVFILSFILLFSQINCLSVFVSFLSFCVVTVHVFGYGVQVEYNICSYTGWLRSQKEGNADLFPVSAPSLTGYHYILTAASLCVWTLPASTKKTVRLECMSYNSIQMYNIESKHYLIYLSSSTYYFYYQDAALIDSYIGVLNAYEIRVAMHIAIQKHSLWFVDKCGAQPLICQQIQCIMGLPVDGSLYQYLYYIYKYKI